MKNEARARGVLRGVAMVAALSLFVSTEPAFSEVVEARRAYDFVDSLGVDTHISRKNGVMNDEGWAVIGEAIADAGFRYVRTTITNGIGIERARNLHDTGGIRFTLKIDTRPLFGGGGKAAALDQAKIDEMIAMTKELGVDAIVAYEGPNEYNAQRDYNPDWASQLRSFMGRMRNLLKADPETADKPIVAPSIWNRKTLDYQAVGDISNLTDKGCLHNYNGARLPSHDLENRIEDAQIMTGDQPIWVTEFGYNTSVDYPDKKFPITEYSHAKYLPRFAAEFFIRPEVEKAFTYQIIDERPMAEEPERAWGLLRNDFSPKLAYHAIKNTITLLNEDENDFVPSSLDYDLVGDLTDIHSFLVQKQSGEFYLVLWQEVDSYDRKARVDLHPEPRPLTLLLNTPVAEASTFLPTGLDIGDPQKARLPVDVYSHPVAISLDVPDELLIVEIVPGLDMPGASAPPAAPVDLTARWGGGTSIALTWQMPAGDVGVAGYKVYKGDKHIATTDVTSHLFNGKWGRTYKFSVSALDSAGNESARSQQVKVKLSSAWVRNQ